jgi:hypothetical protein
MSTGLSDHEKHQQPAGGGPGALANNCASDAEGRLVVRVTPALKMLGDPGRGLLYQWINDGTLESYLVGRTRFITIRSIKQLIAALLAQAHDENGRLKKYHHNLALGAPPAAATDSVKGQRGRSRPSKEKATRVA